MLRDDDPAALDQVLAQLADRAHSAGVDMLQRALHGDDPAALDQAIELLTAAVAAAPDDHPDRPMYLSNLCGALQTRFQCTGAAADLDEAVRVGQQAVTATPEDEPEMLSNLAAALHARFECTGVAADLDQAIDLLATAVAAAPDDHPDYAMYLSNLGAALRARFERTGVAADLDQAIDLLTAASDAVPDDHRALVMCLNNLANALRDRFERTGAAADLDQAIDLLTAAVDVAPDDQPGHVMHLSNLGAALRARFERTGAAADLDEAVRVGRHAVAMLANASENHPGYVMCLTNLGGALQARFERTGAAADLDQAVNFLTAAVAAAPEGHPAHAMCLSNLSGALEARFERTGAAADLDQAIDLLNAAVAAAPDDHPDRAMCLTNLTGALKARYERAGAAADLDEAVRVGWLAVAATPDDHLDRVACLTNLSGALQARFGRIGAAADLDQAIDLLAAAVAATPDDHLNRVAIISNLGLALQARFERTGVAADLDEAIDLLTAAVAAAPDDHPDRAGTLSNLVGALHVRFKHTGAAADLDKAVTVGQQAVAAAPDGHRARVMCLTNLGLALQARFERTGGAADLDEAVRVGRQAVAATPVDHPDRAMHLTHLGFALQTRFERAGAAADLDEAVRGWEQASRSTVAPVTRRLTAAGLWAQAVVRWRGPAAAAEVYAEAVDLLPLLAWRGISHRDQQRLLETHAASLGRDGAACAIAAGRPDLAVELLEAGRGVYWSQLLGTRSDLTVLQRVAPELAEQLRNCRTVLEQPTQGGHATGLDPAQVVEARMRAAHRFDDLVKQVRALRPTDAFPHPDRFLKPPPLSTLLPGAGDDPIAIINISRWRCDALLLTHHGVTPIALNLTQEQVVDEATRYLIALHKYNRHTGADRVNLEMAITSTLEWLWDHITAPILNQLGHTETPTGQWPRLWWCPTGALTGLPVHAAGYHHTPDTVLDLVVSSYAPTVRALTSARAREASAQPAKILVITLPDTPGQSPLPGATVERDLLTSRFTSRARTVLSGADANRDNIMTDIAGHRWLHASCHGTQDLTDPSTGGLLPYDWKTAGLITVADLISPDHAGGEFAFLSACKTATGGITSLDEAINLTAAMQHAGWRHVIGTLWSVWQDAATIIAQGLYPQLLHDDRVDTRAIAHALHHTIRALRDTNRERPSTWASFIHAGP
jgi:CHAT domain-containing protein/tetratricopeptide (TPR) repeat protein